MNSETITEKLNDEDCTRPIKYKMWIMKDVQYKTTLSKSHHGGYWHILLNNDERTPRIQRILWQGLHSTKKLDISNVSLNLWRKPHAMNGLLEAHVIVPVDNTLMMRGISCYHNRCYVGGGYFTHTATGVELSLSLSSGISWRKIHKKQAPAMAVVTILDKSIIWSKGVNYRRLKHVGCIAHIAEQRTCLVHSMLS